MNGIDHYGSVYAPTNEKEVIEHFETLKWPYLNNGSIDFLERRPKCTMMPPLLPCATKKVERKAYNLQIAVICLYIQ